MPRHGWVNLHFSLLPAWRGAAPVQRAMMAGDEVTGATTFLLEEGLDTGPVFGVLTETIRPADTAGDLLDRLADAGAGLLVATLDGIEDGSSSRAAAGGRRQPRAEGHRRGGAGRLAQPALAVDRRIRGCTPAPGAWTTFRGERLKLGPVRGPPTTTSLAARTSCEVSRNARPTSAPAAGAVRSGDVQPAGQADDAGRRLGPRRPAGGGGAAGVTPQ